MAFENGLVVFKRKDYKDNSKEKHMTVTAEEFIRRFLLHVLPHKFVKVKQYDILSNRNRMTKLEKCKQILKVSISKIIAKVKLTTAEIFFKLTGVDINKFPCCSRKMMIKRKLKPKRPYPPEEISMII